MKILILVLGIIGGSLSAFLGLKWLRDSNQSGDLVTNLKSMGADTGEITKLKIASVFLLIGLVGGILGAVLTLRNKAKIGGIIMLACVAIPAVLAPNSLVFTFILAIAGILALIAKPKHLN